MSHKWRLSGIVLSCLSLPYSIALRDLRNLLRLVGINPSGFGEHSGRRGGTTAAAAKGATLDE